MLMFGLRPLMDGKQAIHSSNGVILPMLHKSNVRTSFLVVMVFIGQSWMKTSILKECLQMQVYANARMARTPYITKLNL